MTLKPIEPMASTPWESDLTKRLAGEFGSTIGEFAAYVDQNFLTAQASEIVRLIEYLKVVEEFDYLVDITAVDYPLQDAKRFEVIYFLYSYSLNVRVRVKTRVADGEKPPSITGVFPGANWLEREVFDMFGIEFAGHPNMIRILLPEEWRGHPLRKDYSILQMDNQWVKENLGIESGQ
ncbi:MAG TPA: NADH-quinone oxidoreductase subunit C [Bryobacteraceae bacterium]|nr:NADH-quinone oxidoreductase subunit C [Bryobacteraceae bacterium]